MLFPEKPALPSTQRTMPSMDYLFRELKRKGVTLQLLWYEYRQANPDGYQYSQFCYRYRQWAKKLDVTLRQEHRAGEKLFIDYAGQTVPIIDPATGECVEAQIFIAALGASSYTFAEASLAQDLPSWIRSHVHAFQFFGGVTQILVPDNLKSGITHPHRYEPDINPTYQDLAQHYQTTVIPARSGHPKDKAKVESAVLVAERWILAALRNHTFFSLAELNHCIAQKLTDLNTRKFQKLDARRKDLFDSVDKPALIPLPSIPYEYAEWKKARVNIDYHVEVDRHYYSVPYQLVREQVDVRLTATTVRSCSRIRGSPAIKEVIAGRLYHLAPTHAQKPPALSGVDPIQDCPVGRKNGPNTKQLLSAILQSKTHPEQGFRSCLGIMRLTKSYSSDRLEAACSRALLIKAYSFKSVESILKKTSTNRPFFLIKTKPIRAPSQQC
jgi:transposase